MSRKSQINRVYIEESVTDFNHPYRKGRIASQFDDDDEVEVSTSSIRNVEAETPDHEWTQKRLERRLVEAARVLQVTVSRVGPSGARSFWPESFPLFEDEAGQVWRTYEPERASRARLQATSAQIIRSDEALSWPKRYVKEPRVLRVMNAWIASKGFRRPWTSVVKKKGWSLATADRCRARAVAEIIQGLRRDGVLNT